jgi:hypothetical protein
VRRKITFGEVEVGPAHTAHDDLHTHLTGTGLRRFPLDEAQGPLIDWSRLVNHPGSHAPMLALASGENRTSGAAHGRAYK